MELDTDRLEELEGMLSATCLLWWENYESSDASDLGEWNYLRGARDAVRLVLGTGKLDC